MRSVIGAALIWSGLAAVAVAGETDLTHRLALQVSDIEAVSLEHNAAWLKLTPSAGAELHDITSQNQGDLLEITVDGVKAITARISAVVDSGAVGVTQPSDDLLSKLKQID